MKNLICHKCGDSYINAKFVNSKLIIKDPFKFLNTCKNCRSIKRCKICETEFNNYQNKTCSNECSKIMKQQTSLKNWGTHHQFCKESLSRRDWELTLFQNEGINNVFQRESVKEKIKQTITSNYGVDNPSKSELIKEKKKKTLKETLKINPNLFKENWKKINENFLNTIGYDPRLHAIDKASKESLLVFKSLLDWCISLGIENNDIYLGIENRQEFFLQTKNKLYFYDFCIRSKKIIIEFHGTAFHANINDPNVKLWKNPFINESYKENIKKTELKNKQAIKKGFKILEIWSNINPKINIEKCKTFITESL